MKWIINKYVFFIIFGITISLLTSLVIRETVLKKIRTKYHEYLSTKDALVVYSFAEDKQQTLLEVSATLLGNDILAPQRYPDYNIDKLAFLCPSLNDNVKNIILENFDKQHQSYLEYKKVYQENNMTLDIQKDKQDFIIAYDNLIDFCEKQK